MLRAKIALLFLLLPLQAGASDLFAPFQGSRMAGLTRSSTIAEYDGTVDASGNLIDISGSNYALQSQDFSTSWTSNEYTAIVVNSVRAPDGTLTADALKEYGSGGGGAAGDSHYVNQNITLAVDTTYTASLYVRPAARTWMRLNRYKSDELQYCYFNLVGSGTIGTCTADTVGAVSKISDVWYRVSITKKQVMATALRGFTIYAAVADGDVTYAGSDQVAMYIWGAQESKNDQWRQGPGVYHPTATVTKPLHDLAPTSAPTMAYSYTQDRDGNRHRARSFSGSNYYSVAHHDSMNIFDGDFVVTQVLKSPAAAPGASIISLSHGLSVGDGVYMGMNSSGYYYSFFNKAGVQAGPATTTSFADGRYHTLQLERISNVATMYVDGTATTPVSVSTYGIDGSRTFYVGCYSGPGAYWTSDILYTRIDSSSMTNEQLAKDREVLQGVSAGSGNLSPGWTFTRTTTASMTYANGTVGYVAANAPRVGGDGGGVLIEEQRENKALQSQTFGTTWTKRAGDSISSDSATILAPDGTATADGLIGEAVEESHYFVQSITYTAASWTASVWARPGNKNWIRIYSSAFGGGAYFNVGNGSVGSFDDGVTAKVQQYADGWYRCSVSFTGAASASNTYVYVCDADSDDSFTGDGATVNMWLWGAQVEAGAHATSYIPTTSAAVTRTQDSLTMEPWKLNKGVNPGNANPTMTARFESDVYATGTYTTEGGSYAMTVAGDTKRLASQTLGDYFSFDGTGDALSRADASFNPSGDFTVVAVVTPNTISGSHVIAGKYDTVGDQRGWMLSQSNANVNFIRTTDGKVGTVLTATCTSCLVAGKSALVTASYSTTGGLAVRVDGYADGTQAATGVVHPSTANFMVANDSGTSYWSGSINLLKYIDGYAAVESDHDNMYAQLKQANALPVKIGNSYEAKKLYVEFDAKCLYTGTNDTTTNMYMVNIGGNTGNADSNTNVMSIYWINSSSSVIAAIGANGEDTVRYMSLAKASISGGMGVWHHYKFYFNLADLTTSTGYIDTTAFFLDPSMTGAKDFDLTNTRIRVGQVYNNVTNGDCRVKNLRVRTAP